jgi:hypothetical protein
VGPGVEAAASASVLSLFPTQPQRSSIATAFHAAPARKQRLFVLRLKRAERSVKQAIRLLARRHILRRVRRDEDSDHFRYGIDEVALPSNAEECELRLARIDEPSLIAVTREFQSGAEPQVRCVCRGHGTHPCGWHNVSHRIARVGAVTFCDSDPFPESYTLSQVRFQKNRLFKMPTHFAR